MCQHGLPVGDQRRAVAPDGAADGDILLAHQQRLFHQAAADLLHRAAAQRRVQALHAVDGPEQVDRRGTGRRQRGADGLHLPVEILFASAERAQCHSHGRGYADCRRAADNHIPDRRRHFFVSAARHVRFFQRQPCLVDHDDGPVHPLYRLYHATPG
jgi:hypothetical protein